MQVGSFDPTIRGERLLSSGPREGSAPEPSNDGARLQPGLRPLAAVALIGALALLAGCASSTSTSTGANTVEGGVKIPSSTVSTATTTTVHVTVSDTSGLAGPMSISVSPATAPAGDVTFVVKNTGTIEHEAVVLALKTNTPFDKLPVTYGGDPPAPVKTGADKVSEDTNIGETGDPNLKPGDTRTFTIKHMTAGNYAIVCNIAKHYGLGMRAAFTVTNPTTTVNVTVSDTSGLAGPMSISVSPATAPAGDVTFVVKNTGTIEHEAVVLALKTNTPFDKLPVTYGGDPPAPVKTGADKVSEDTNIGETGDPNLKPGDTRTFTIKHMTAGNYAIVCNIAKHYGLGMRAAFTVPSASFDGERDAERLIRRGRPDEPGGVARDGPCRRRHLRRQEHRHHRTRSRRPQDQHPIRPAARHLQRRPPRPGEERRRQSRRGSEHRRNRRPQPQTGCHSHVHDQEHDSRWLRDRLQPRPALHQGHARRACGGLIMVDDTHHPSADRLAPRRH